MVQRRRQQQQQFSSEGFDLDALASSEEKNNNRNHHHHHNNGNAEEEEEVIYEIGGGVTTIEKENPTPPPTNPEQSVTDIADDYKAKGNQAFQEKNWLEAVDMYTAAIRTLPGMTATELLDLQKQYEKEQHEMVRQRLATQDEQRRKAREAGEDYDDDNKKASEQQNKEEPPPPFRAPPHVYADRLSVLHANRAAALMQVQEYDQALPDVNVAILWKPTYVKAYLRRATLYEKMNNDNNTEQALADAKTAQQLDPHNTQIRAMVNRLQKLEDERLEKLKAETLDKLKDLGNSILGNFGLSLDNFKAVQDPNTGSYSISFNQNNNGDSSSN